MGAISASNGDKAGYRPYRNTFILTCLHERALSVTSPHKSDNRVLHLNVGFLLKEGVGVLRVVPFDEHKLIVEDIDLERLAGELTLTRTAQGILVRGELNAETFSECGRCLTAVSIPFKVNLSDHFVHPPASAAEDDYVVDEGGIINLQPTIREQAIITVPMQVLCNADCKGLCSQCGDNLNEVTCECEHGTIDPRMAGLKILLDE